MKKILSLLFIAILVMMTVAVPVNAASSLSISRTKTEILVGEDVTVTFTFKDSVAIGGFDITIDFDSSKLTFVSASNSLGSGTDQVNGKTIRSIHYNVGSTSTSAWLKLTFKAKAVGTANVSIIKNKEVTDTVGEFLGAPTGSTTISIKEESKSNNANLSSLTVPSGCTLVPKFSKNTTSYTCTVPYEITKFPMDWTTEDKDATTSVTALQTLKVGENSRTVTVTAADGTKKSYTVKVIREAQKVTPTPTAKPSASAKATPTPTPALTPTPTPTSAPIIAVIDGIEHNVKDKITLQVPENFKKEIYSYESNPIETAVLGDVCLIQLFDGSTDRFFVYDKATHEFTPFRTVSVIENKLVVLDEKPEISLELKEEHIVIGNGEYLCWTNERLGEGYYLLNVMNNEGKIYPALYCKEDGTIQKLSQKLIESENVIILPEETPEATPNAETPTPAPENTEITAPQNTQPGAEEKKEGFFSKLPLEYIGIFVCAILLIIIIIIVIVIIAGNRKDKKNQHDWGFEDETNNGFDFTVEDVKPNKEDSEDEDFE